MTHSKLTGWRKNDIITVNNNYRTKVMIRQYMQHIIPKINKYRDDIFRIIPVLFTCLLFYSCTNPLTPVDSEEKEKVISQLNDRSFRQFAPSKDAMKSKGVILDFFNNEESSISLWAQYAEGNTAINEWEIFAKEYRIEKKGSEYILYFEEPRSHQNLPNKCDNCIELSGISVSIRNLFEDDKIQFKINDEDDVLPSPFPIFTSWTSFQEDEYFD